MPKLSTIRLDSPSDARWRGAIRPDGMLLVCDPATRITTLLDGDKAPQTWSDPLEALDWLASTARSAAAGHRDARWVGFISYELSRLLNNVTAQMPTDLSLPLFAFARGTIERASSLDLSEPADVGKVGAIQSTFSRFDYERAVRRVIEYIAAGDAYQVNLSQCFAVESGQPPLHIYARLIRRSPAEYGAYLDFGDFQILSNSPELFFRIDPGPGGRRRIVNRPIKGTRPRAAGMYEELLRSEKDQSELAMIVDLQRNDLGRICEIGSVRVTDPRSIEEQPTVYHGVATIEGMLRADLQLSQILAAIFPCGSVTGCPKIRAMQIIDELEPVRRGVYCGAIGYLDPDGSMQFNVAIRTMTVADGTAFVPVGGGIVADSTPPGEYQETLVKARAMFDALGVELPMQQ